LNIFVSNVLLILKIMNFEIVSNKSYSFLCDLKHGCIIYKWYGPRYNKINYIEHIIVN
jgi:hypothetical protein